jgi:hypothetical protein
MTTPIKYTATLDDNPFAAGAQRLGTVLQGIQQRFSQVGRDFTTVGQGMSAQMGHITDSVRGEVAAMGGHFSSLLEAVGRTRLGSWRWSVLRRDWLQARRWPRLPR